MWASAARVSVRVTQAPELWQKDRNVDFGSTGLCPSHSRPELWQQDRNVGFGSTGLCPSHSSTRALAEGPECGLRQHGSLSESLKTRALAAGPEYGLRQHGSLSESLKHPNTWRPYWAKCGTITLLGFCCAMSFLRRNSLLLCSPGTWVMSEDTVPMHCENTTAPGAPHARPRVCLCPGV